MFRRRTPWILGAICLALIIAIQAVPALASPLPRFGFVRIKSEYNFTETTQRLEREIENANFNLIAKVDHAAGAASVNLDLRPTQLFIFGNPAGGTPFMQCTQTMGLDLPLKAIVWQDRRDQTWLGFNVARLFNFRYGLNRCSTPLTNNLERVDQALRRIALATTQPEANQDS